MKRTILGLLIISCIAFVMPAKGQIKFGLKLGTNISNTDFSDIKELDQFKDVVIKNNAGFFIGPMMDIKIPILGFGADLGLNYSYKSYSIENNSNQKDVLNKQHMIEIPINLKYNIGLGDVLGIYLAVGPSFGFNLNPDSFWEDLTKGIADRIDGNTYSYKRKNTEVALNLGAGLTILKHLQVGFNYNLGLTDAAKGSARNLVNAAWDNNAVKSRLWQISAAYLF